ncbi:hypothetical protein [Ulvibacterium sp.]|uniref:hypothetical protein n=1 Tax=Ulvibacterium sp. TaxID=2665914 RepID=UPI003BAAF54B
MILSIAVLLNCKRAKEKLVIPNNVHLTAADTLSTFPEVIKLTQGPKQHWFGYYDKLQVDPSGRYVLGMKVDTFYRSPTITDTLIIGMVDLKENNKWIPLGQTKAWGWQQGCMLQWIPGSQHEIIWNDLQEGKFVSHILNVKTGKKRTLPKAIYTLSNDGSFALGTEFSRIQNLRPGYGYPGVEDPYAEVKAPEKIGIYKIDLKTGETKMLVSIAEMAAIPNSSEDLRDYWNYFNHILISPDDRRFVFLHRWRKELGNRADRAVGGFVTRMVSANVDGNDIYLLDPSGHTSHFIWKDNQTLCMWTKPNGHPEGFYLFTDKSNKIVPVGKGIMIENGHNTYVRGTENEWILNDTYPSKSRRLQTLYLYHVPTQKKLNLGQFYMPKKFRKEWRCDLHPKSSSDGKWIIFDSTHDGDGRQMYMVNIENIVAQNN